MWCGPTSCQASAKGRDACPSGRTCVPVRDSRCFVKPCLGFGECSDFPPPPSKCHPGSCYQDNSCANITFTFNKETMPHVSESQGSVVIVTLRGGDVRHYSVVSGVYGLEPNLGSSEGGFHAGSPLFPSAGSVSGSDGLARNGSAGNAVTT